MRWTMRSRHAHAVLAATLVVGVGVAAASADTRRIPSPFTISVSYPATSLGLDDPHGLAIGPDGDLYVTDRSQRVSVISPAGKVLRRWGKPGSKPGEFRFASVDPSNPADIHEKIAVGRNGLVYVSDSGNGRVQVFTAAGRFVRQLGGFGSGRAKFLSPYDLVVDTAGDVFVADDDLGTLTKFSPEGKLVWRIGGSGSANPDLVGFFKVSSIDAHGRLVVANDANGKILYVDGNGHEVDSFRVDRRDFGEPAPCEATVDAGGTTYVSGCGRGPTIAYDREHRLVARWTGSSVPLLTGPFFGPRGEVFALGWDGSIARLHMTLASG
jgi:DNA-binding beta-propeller fold protein YncE